MGIANLLDVDLHDAVCVPMRDGAELVADLCLPAGGEPAPALLYRTPYGRVASVTEAYAPPSWYASQGFAVVCQDTRGRGDSPGVFEPFVHEATDGADTIEWIAGQPWSNGRVGMYGFSYPGTIQLLAAAEQPAGLRAIAPAMATSSFHDPWTYSDGAFQLAWVFLWVLDLARETAVRAGDEEALAILNELASTPDALFRQLPLHEAFPERVRVHLPYLEDWLARASDDERWQAVSPRSRYSRISVAALHITGWYDVFLAGAVENYQTLVASGAPEQRLVAGPWWHTPWTSAPGSFDFGPSGSSPIDELQVRFFRKHLASAPTPNTSPDPPMRVFVMGENRWRELTALPRLDGEIMTLFLRSDGRANSLGGDGRLDVVAPSTNERPDVLPVDSNLPVTTLGGRSCCYPTLAPMGPADQRAEEGRNDVLVYTGPVLEHDVTLIGAARLTVVVASDGSSADVIARLVDVYPGGISVNVADGNRRVSLSDEPCTVELMLSTTAITFLAGHRIRLDLMGSSFPLFDRNPHNGSSGTKAAAADFRFARHIVMHDIDRQSFIELPLAPTSPEDDR